MTNEFANHDESPLALADAELEQLLDDAYDAPPMPRSLLKRIDRAVEAEWGKSPKLAVSPTVRWKNGLSRKARWAARSLPVAASLVVLGVLFTGDARSYGWAAMIEALEKHGIVQIDGTDESRWLSLADGVVSQRTPDSSRLLNVRILLQLPQNRAIWRRSNRPQKPCLRQTRPFADRGSNTSRSCSARWQPRRIMRRSPGPARSQGSRSPSAYS